MKKTLVIAFAALLLAACTENEEKLKQRAEELCRYIPDKELQEQSKDYMTADFYAVLDTMFNLLPEFEGMDYEWLYYFVSGNDGSKPEFSVDAVELTDKSHAVATIGVRQVSGNKAFDEAIEPVEHKLYMEKVDGQWLMCDFDGHKADCIRQIAMSRKEQALRDAIGDYLVKEIGAQYEKGEICIPVQMMVHEEEGLFMGDFWVQWYNVVGDTLKCVSGGNHSGVMKIGQENGKYVVSSFEQTVDGAGNDASARSIFGNYYDVYSDIHSDDVMVENIRQQQLGNYVKRHQINAKYYQDYGWNAVAL
jgi:hypothetical protein